MTKTLDITELQEARAEVKLLQRMEQLKTSNGLLFYEPHAKQDLFHRAGACRGRYVRTGNRFGKSQMGVAEDCAWAIGERPWYKKGDSAREIGIPKHAVKLLIVCADWDKSTEIFTAQEQGDRCGKIFKLLPKGSIIGRPHRNHSGHIDRITVKSKWGGESLIAFDTVKSFKMNPMGSESSDWDAIHVDEPIPEDMWKAISRGLVDRDGKYWFTCTPLREMWINDLFIPSELTRSTFNQPHMFDSKWIVTGSMRDNPHLTEPAIRAFEKGLTDAEKDCRMNGIPTALSGVVYKNFKHEKHIYGNVPGKECPVGWDSPTEPPRDFTCRVSIDPHPKTPHAVLFAATSPHGQTFIYRELFKQVLVKDLCDFILQVLDGRKPQEIICDPFAWIPNPITGYTMADEFYASGLPIQKATKELAYGILKTNEALAKDDYLYFHDHLRRTKWEFDHYTWAENKEKPVDKDDHMMECLYRLVLTGLRYHDLSERPKDPKPLDFKRVDYKAPSTKQAMKEFGKVETSAKNRYRSDG